MEGKHKALLLLTAICLLVTSINGVVDLSIKLRQTFTASAISDYDERLTVKVRCSSGRPSFAWWLAWSTLKATCSWHEGLWRLAWRVGSQVVSKVENAITIQVTGSNIESQVTVDYYIEAKKPDGTALGKTLDVTGASCNVGGSISDSTGDMDIASHLSDLGLSTTQDQTVDYWVWVRVTATGLISGQQLVAEVGPIEFDSVTFDYGEEKTENIGHDTIEGSTAGFNIECMIDGLKVTAVHSGKLLSISAYVEKSSDYTGDGYIKFALYSADESGNPGDLIAETEQGQVTTTSETWITLSFTDPPQVTAGEDYYLCVWGGPSDGDSTWNEYTVRFYGSATSFYKGGAGWGGAWPDPMGSVNSLTYNFLIYGTVEYVDWSASWSWYPLPLSIVSLPIGRQILWGLVIGLACFTLVVKLSKPRGGRRGE